MAGEGEVARVANVGEEMVVEWEASVVVERAVAAMAVQCTGWREQLQECPPLGSSSRMPSHTPQ